MRFYHQLDQDRQLGVEIFKGLSIKFYEETGDHEILRFGLHIHSCRIKARITI
jgi:hypothetical protein